MLSDSIYLQLTEWHAVGAPTLPFPTSAASGVSKKKRTRKRTATGTVPSAASLPTHMNQYQMATPLATNQATRAATTSGVSGRRTRIFTVTCSKRSPKLQSVNKFARFVCTSPPNHSARLSTHCDRAMEDAYVRFGPNLRKIQAWPTRLSPQPAADEDSTSPAELYARAVPTLLRWKGRPLESTLWLCHARHDPKSCSQML